MIDELIGYRGQDDDEVFVLETDTDYFDPTPITAFKLVIPGLGTYTSSGTAGLFTWPVAAKDRDGADCQGIRLKLAAAAIPAGRYVDARIVGILPGYPNGVTWSVFNVRMYPEAPA